MRRRTAEDDQLIRMVAHGDAAAFAELMRRHRRWVHRLLTAFTRDPDQAEDLTQETFTRALRHAAGYRGGRGAFVPWLRRIAINVGNLHARRRGHLPLMPLEVIAEGNMADAGADPLLAVLSGSLQAEIHAALATLPDDQRQALVLRYFGGLAVLEIARVQRCPEGTV